MRSLLRFMSIMLTLCATGCVVTSTTPSSSSTDGPLPGNGMTGSWSGPIAGTINFGSYYASNLDAGGPSSFSFVLTTAPEDNATMPPPSQVQASHFAATLTFNGVPQTGVAYTKSSAGVSNQFQGDYTFQVATGKGQYGAGTESQDPTSSLTITFTKLSAESDSDGVTTFHSEGTLDAVLPGSFTNSDGSKMPTDPVTIHVAF